MAQILKMFSQLVERLVGTSTDIIAIQSGLSTYKITKKNFLKAISINTYTEDVYDNGSLGTGTFTPDCDNNGNGHKLTVTGNISIAVPTKTLSAGESLSGTIRLSGADAHTITFDANYDWGTDGTPTLTANSFISFYREEGWTKTWVSHKGGFA